MTAHDSPAASSIAVRVPSSAALVRMLTPCAR
ncbi:Uncharacterised protein [Mycobacteroides abscessus]|nr:Uncharacterised protein [Mycobacteroides abscessus]